MISTEDRRASARTGRVSLILPLFGGSTIGADAIAEYRRILEEEAGFLSVEIIIARPGDDEFANIGANSLPVQDGFATEVVSAASDWPGLVRSGLWAASGEYLIVLDVNGRYTPGGLTRVIDAVRNADFDLAVAVPHFGRSGVRTLAQSRPGFGFVSRIMLGTSDACSRLFALRRVVWDGSTAQGTAHGSTLVLDSLLRRRARCVDVLVAVDDQFRPGRLMFGDLRALKRILDGRFGNYSRLVQFCGVGASGMVVDLSFYALLQFLLSFTWLASQKSTLLGGSWHLAIAAAMSIAIALVWNFTLNRRLTFNDAYKGALVRQFFTYVLSNAVAIVLSFSVRLYLPAHVDFFERHRLAAAVVGIVAATGVSFSMSRWLVFGRRSDVKRSTHFPLEAATVGQPTAVP